MTETVVLLSGGIDSASCLAFYGQLDHVVSGVFIDYGQPVREQEEKSAAAIAAYYKIPLTTIRCSGPQTNYAGEIAGRNALLVFAALLFRPIQRGIIALGIHHGTTYYDCSQSFADDMGRIVSGYTNGRVALGAPFLSWDKQMLVQFALQANVPVELTWSCEIGPATACGKCLSCRDREKLHVRSSV
jgi:7-cyano-7-deazaguanine synthase